MCGADRSSAVGSPRYAFDCASVEGQGRKGHGQSIRLRKVRAVSGVRSVAGRVGPQDWAPQG